MSRGTTFSYRHISCRRFQQVPGEFSLYLMFSVTGNPGMPYSLSDSGVLCTFAGTNTSSRIVPRREIAIFILLQAASVIQFESHVPHPSSRKVFQPVDPLLCRHRNAYSSFSVLFHININIHSQSVRIELPYASSAINPYNFFHLNEQRAVCQDGFYGTYGKNYYENYCAAPASGPFPCFSTSEIYFHFPCAYLAMQANAVISQVRPVVYQTAQ